MTEVQGKGRALITGASSGIGMELARVFASHGHPLILVARTESKLTALADEFRSKNRIDVTVIPADLAKPEGAADLFRAVEEQDLAVDVLVNNAGVMPMGAFADADPHELSDMVVLNVLSVTALARLAVAPMIARRNGKILNVASLASFQPLPSLAAYAASKAFVLSLTEALAEELRGTGVTATALCPGFTDTNMVSRAQEENAILRRLPSAMKADAKAVADEGYKACMDGQVVRVPGMALSMATSLIQAQRSMVRTLTGLFGRQAI